MQLEWFLKINFGYTKPIQGCTRMIGTCKKKSLSNGVQGCTTAQGWFKHAWKTVAYSMSILTLYKCFPTAYGTMPRDR